MNTDYGLGIIISMYVLNLILILLNWLDRKKIIVLLSTQKKITSRRVSSLKFRVLEPRVA